MALMNKLALAAALAMTVAVPGATAEIMFRATPSILPQTHGQDPGDEQPGDGDPVTPSPAVSVSLPGPDTFRLTTDEAASLEPTSESVPAGATFALVGGSAPCGLSVDPTTGVISGTASGTAGDTCTFAIEVLHGGESLAQSDPVSKTLRAPLEVAVIPGYPDPGMYFLEAGAASLPVDTTGAGASGGVGPFTWSLEGAPSWISVTADTDTSAALLNLVSEAVAGTESFMIRVEDAEARVAEAEMTVVTVAPPSVISADDGQSGDDFGASVSASADGRSLVIGAPGATVGGVSNAGAAYVFVESDGAWVLEAKLTELSPMSSRRIGTSVAISSDGSVLVAVGARTNTTVGAALVFERTGGQWTLAAHLSPPSNFDFDDNYGSAVAVSGDGSAIAVGAPRWTNDNRGLVYYYVKQGGAWTELTRFRARVGTSSGSGNHEFGAAIALSHDASTMVVGSPIFPNGGAFHVVTRPAGGWAESAYNGDPQIRIRAQDVGMSSNALFGHSVAVSADGTALVVGAPAHDGGHGAFLTFSLTGSSAAPSNLVLEDSETFSGVSSFSGSMGESLALSDDGSRLVVGGESVGIAGEAVSYARSGTGWSLLDWYTDADAVSDARYGASVATDSSGTRIFVGGPGNAIIEDSTPVEKGSVLVTGE